MFGKMQLMGKCSFCKVFGLIVFLNAIVLADVISSIPLERSLGIWSVRDVQGNGHATQSHLTSLGRGESATGEIMSQEIEISELPLSIFVRGWDGADGKKGLNRVELIDSKTKQVLHKISPPLSDRAKKFEFNENSLRGKTLQIRVVDANSDGGYAWIGLDGYSIGKQGISRFQSIKDLANWDYGDDVSGGVVDHYGIGFLEAGTSVFVENGESRFELGFCAKNLFFLGMTNSIDNGVPGWFYPKDYSLRFFVGDKLGEIRLEYSDGQTEIYPLLFGENIWWGKKFHDYPEPFKANLDKSEKLTNLLQLYRVSPTSPNPYIAVITPRPVAIEKVVFVDAKEKAGKPVVIGLAVESAANLLPSDAVLCDKQLSDDIKDFVANKALKPAARGSKERLKKVRNLLYTTTENLPQHLDLDIPDDYQGPQVKFSGDIYTDILTNMFYHNLHQMSKKVDSDGMYRTSSIGAASFGSYQGFGTYAEHVGVYSSQVWSRDLGRAIQELVAFGKLEDAKRCASYCFEKANLWQTRDDDLVKIEGKKIPPHWCRNIADPRATYNMGCFESDGHGLIMMFIYNMWRRLPQDSRDQWLRDNWLDVKAAGDWILWQFDNPKLSNAKNGILYTDSEAAFGYGNITPGYTVYADYVCMEALTAFSQMADSLDKKTDSDAWKARAKKMRSAIIANYSYDPSPKARRVWTLKHAGWAYQSSLLGPLILQADREGVLPEKNSEFYRITEASYLRLIRKWRGESPQDFDEFWHDSTDVPFLGKTGLLNPPFGAYGVAMGYGQGFITQAALLLDRMDDAQGMLEWAAKNTYYADYEPYIVPEGSEVHPSGNYWFRTGDLGNGVQQAEIMKVLRLVIGVDDSDPAQLLIAPRMPASWDSIEISEFPAWVQNSGTVEQISLKYKLDRQGEKLQFTLESDRVFENGLSLRLGPFEKFPNLSTLQNQGNVHTLRTAKSGGKYWIHVALRKGASKCSLAVN